MARRRSGLVFSTMTLAPYLFALLLPSLLLLLLDSSTFEQARVVCSISERPALAQRTRRRRQSGARLCDCVRQLYVSAVRRRRVAVLHVRPFRFSLDVCSCSVAVVCRALVCTCMASLSSHCCAGVSVPRPTSLASSARRCCGSCSYAVRVVIAVSAHRLQTSAVRCTRHAEKHVPCGGHAILLWTGRLVVRPRVLNEALW